MNDKVGVKDGTSDGMVDGNSDGYSVGIEDGNSEGVTVVVTLGLGAVVGTRREVGTVDGLALSTNMTGAGVTTTGTVGVKIDGATIVGSGTVTGTGTTTGTGIGTTGTTTGVRVGTVTRTGATVGTVTMTGVGTTMAGAGAVGSNTEGGNNPNNGDVAVVGVGTVGVVCRGNWGIVGDSVDDLLLLEDDICEFLLSFPGGSFSSCCSLKRSMSSSSSSSFSILSFSMDTFDATSDV